jgi:hypothetical protein
MKQTRIAARNAEMISFDPEKMNMKKLVMISVCLLGLAAASTLKAEDAPSATPKPRARAKADPKMLEKYDTNKNGKIDPDEREAMKKDRQALHDETIKKYDKNGDGKLDADERAAMREDLKKNKKDRPRRGGSTKTDGGSSSTTEEKPATK